jgi:hypothetical protein
VATVRGQGCEFSNLEDGLLFLREVAKLRPSVDIRKASHKSVQKGTARALESAQNEVFLREEERYLPGEGDLVIGLNHRISAIRYIGITAGVIISLSSSWNWVGVSVLRT